jgi:crotonobetainyl-CoA:carnitine CoA-transferase CaiB-like acyl-CoA transferase
MSGALQGLLVVDLTSHLSGPYCAMLLADHGADVIKVERPDGGDEARQMPPFVGGESAPFMIWNRNKRSVVLDLKSADGREKLLRLIDRADVLIENFRPGTADRLGLSWPDLSRRNPRLIYGSVSGFGQTGPYRDRGGFDLVTQGMSGLMSICGPKDGPPHRLPIAISDIAAGMHLAVGILSALEARHRTGRGQFVETSLLESALSLGVYEAAHVFATGEPPPRLGQAHRGSAPYQVFETADGWLTVGAAQQNFWERLCDLLGMPEMRDDPRFRTNADRVRNNDELVLLLQPGFKKKPSAEWLEAMQAAGIPAGPVLGFDEVLADPHVRARGMVVETRHPAAGAFNTLGLAAKLSDTPGDIRRPAPRLGEHTAEVLASLEAASEGTAGSVGNQDGRASSDSNQHRRGR